MSIYDSTNNISNESDRTTRVKLILTRIITNEMRNRGYKVDIREEVPAVIDGKKYHADLGVMFRSKTEFDFYHFFIVEIDWVIGHETFRADRKERIRDFGFLNHYGITTVRIPLVKVSGKNALKEQDLFDTLIWPDLVDHYIDPAGEKMKIWAELNRRFAILLKENSSTQCDQCSHKAHQHNLAGCEFQNTNKAKLFCNCKNPYYTSDL